MPKEKYLVCFDVQHAGSGYDAPAEYKKSTTGKSTGKPYAPGQAFGTSNGTAVGFGMSAQVFQGKITEVEAESVEEACIVAREAYGSRAGGGALTGACIASKGKEYEWAAIWVANFFVVQNLEVHDPKQSAAKYESAKLLEYVEESEANKFIGSNVLRAEVMKIEAGNVAEAQKAAEFYGGGTTTTPIVVTEAQWKTSWMKIQRDVLSGLTDEKRQAAGKLLEQYEALLKNNPLIGYKPHPKQKVFHSSHEQLKAFLGGNRSGKTTAGILDNLIQAVDSDSLPPHLQPYKKWQPPFYCRIIVPDFTSTLEGVIFQKLREWTPKNQLAGNAFDKAYDKTRRKLNFKNGSWMDFLTFEQDLDKFGGAALHRVHYDEEPPSNIRRESTMRLIDYGGDEIFSMTPLHGMSWMYDAIYEPWTKGQLKDATVVLVDMDDNPHLDEKTKLKALEGLTREEREARKSGRFVHFAGMIYGEFSRNLHVIPEGDVPKDVRIYVGIDPGIRHMAAVVWTYLTSDDTLVAFDELALQGHTVKQVAEAIKLINHKHQIRPDWYVIDPSAKNIMHQTGRSDQMEFTDNGIITMLGQNSVTAGINRVKQRLESHKLLVMANCKTLIDEFRKYRWATPTRSEDDAKEKPVKADDHLLDALRYVVSSRPYVAHTPDEEEILTPMERMMREELEGFSRKQIAKTEYGGIFA